MDLQSRPHHHPSSGDCEYVGAARGDRFSVSVATLGAATAVSYANSELVDSSRMILLIPADASVDSIRASG